MILLQPYLYTLVTTLPSTPPVS